MTFPILNNLQPDYPLKSETTFNIGGPARFFVEVRQPAEMQEILIHCHANQLPFFILGKGSNVLFDDRGFNGVVIGNRIDFISQPSESSWHVGAGCSFSLLGSRTARQGWSGLEFASGIPGSVGGAIFMNAGANGHETCETLQSVDFIHADGKFEQLARSGLEFNYRFSSFQMLPGAIIGAVFQLHPSQTARKDQLDLIQYRKNTQPYGDKSAGCVFRNPVHRSAGALIDQAGLKGKKIGGAQVSNLHANFVVNTGNASSEDIRDLLEFVQRTIKNEMGIDLENEIRYIPFQE